MVQQNNNNSPIFRTRSTPSPTRTKTQMSYSGVNLKPAGQKPADFDGSAANAGVKPADNAAPAFAGFKLKSAPKPADFDGSSANVGTKPAEHTAAPSVALKHANPAPQ